MCSVMQLRCHRLQIDRDPESSTNVKIFEYIDDMYVHVCVCVCVCVCSDVYMCVCIRIRGCMYTCIYLSVC